MKNMKKINYKLINLALIVIIIFFMYKTGNLWIGVGHKIMNILIIIATVLISGVVFIPIGVVVRKKTAESKVEYSLKIQCKRPQFVLFRKS